MLSLVYKGIALPVCWSLLDKRGNSHTEERMAIMTKFICQFGKEKIPAAGSGQRLGGQLPKQYQSLAGLPMLVHTIRALQNHPAVQHIYVVLSPHDTLFIELCAPLVEACTPLYCGGNSRAASVMGGVRALAQHYHHTSENPWLMVHDAARPALTLR